METETETNALPGVLIRRLHQIHAALFAEECTGFGITPVQYSILSLILHRPGLDRVQIGEEAGVERGMLANMVARLQETGLLQCFDSRLDRRQKLLSLTPRGKALLEHMQGPVRRAHDRTIEALEPEARAVFMASLGTLTDAGRARLRGK